MTEFELEMRRKIIAAPLGQTVVMPIGRESMPRIRRLAKEFASAKNYPIVIIDSPDSLCFKRVTKEEADQSKWPEMGKLEIGESHVYDVPVPMHQRIRMAASSKNRGGEVLLSCTREGSLLRVTRHPLTPDEINAHGVSKMPPRASKYGLERLETETEITLHPKDHAELLSIRALAHTKSKLTGWKLVTRVQIDGSLKITRINAEVSHG